MMSLLSNFHYQLWENCLFKTSLKSSGFILMRYTISCFLLIPVFLARLSSLMRHTQGEKKKQHIHVNLNVKVV